MLAINFAQNIFCVQYSVDPVTITLGRAPISASSFFLPFLFLGNCCTVRYRGALYLIFSLSYQGGEGLCGAKARSRRKHHLSAPQDIYLSLLFSYIKKERIWENCVASQNQHKCAIDLLYGKQYEYTCTACHTVY